MLLISKRSIFFLALLSACAFGLPKSFTPLGYGPAYRSLSLDSFRERQQFRRSLQPKISYSRETVAKPGEDVTIDCGVEGIDLSGVADFSVSWSKIDAEKPINPFPISAMEKILFPVYATKYAIEHPPNTYQYSLKIRELEASDSGTYVCTVNFGGENQEIEAEVPVHIEQAPFFVDNSTKTLTVTEGDSISIDCRPGGYPTPTVFWQRVDKELPFYGGNFFKDNQLDIPFVEKSHSGRYKCHADNGIGTPAISEVILSVQYGPKVRVANSKVAVTIGNEGIKLECRVDAFPAAQAVWLDGRNEVILGSSNIRVTQRYEELSARQRSALDELDPASRNKVLVTTLHVSKVTFDEIGNYTCQASNSLITVNQTASIVLKTPPKIERQSSRRVFYSDETSLGRNALPISITCQATGVPAPEYKWLKNNEPLIFEGQPRFSLEPNSGSLLIENPTIADNGWYTCIAFNELGVARSDPVYLLNSTRVTFDPVAQPFIELTVEEGRPFKMPCPNATGDPKPEITWAIAHTSTDNEQLTQMEFFSSNRTVVGPDGSAYFTHVTAGDDSESSNITYLCLGMHEVSPQDFSLGISVKLKVIKPEDGLYNGELSNLNIEPFLIYGSPNVTLLHGAKLNRLWCIFGGEPEPEIRWEKVDGTPFNQDYEFDNFNSTLIIKKTNISHQSKYRCLASNGVGPVVTHDMTVEVDMPPVFRVEMESATANEGDDVTFVCDAEGTGVITYNWYFNGRELSPLVVVGSRRSVEGNRLTIERVTVTDIGNYACNASSMSGYAYGQATLNVIMADHSGSTGTCPEVAALKDELQTVKNSLKELTMSIQSSQDPSLSLIQRIAAKLNLLSQEEVELMRSPGYEEKVNIEAEIVKAANNKDKEPQFVYAEKIQNLRQGVVGEQARDDIRASEDSEGGDNGGEESKGEESKVIAGEEESSRVDVGEEEESKADEVKGDESEAEGGEGENTGVEEGEEDTSKVVEAEGDETKEEGSEGEDSKDEGGPAEAPKVEEGEGGASKVEESEDDNSKVEGVEGSENKVEDELEESNVDGSKAEDDEVEGSEAEEGKEDGSEVQDGNVKESELAEGIVEGGGEEESKVGEAEGEGSKGEGNEGVAAEGSEREDNKIDGSGAESEIKTSEGDGSERDESKDEGSGGGESEVEGSEGADRKA